ncbi:transcriptional regulator [Rhizobium rhizogenes]|uniref:transcriptional regulator n=1 Tax=Rhizobium rhizogenes TaxID=359 RepID=UPI00387065B2
MERFRAHIERAIEAHGSQVKLANAIGCSQQYISWLLSEAKQISAEKALAVEKATGGLVSRHDLRPDVFGVATEVAE